MRDKVNKLWRLVNETAYELLDNALITLDIMLEKYDGLRDFCSDTRQIWDKDHRVECTVYEAYKSYAFCALPKPELKEKYKDVLRSAIEHYRNRNDNLSANEHTKRLNSLLQRTK